MVKPVRFHEGLGFSSRCGANIPHNLWPKYFFKNYNKPRVRNFPGGPVVETLPSNAGGEGSVPGWGARIPHVSWSRNQNIGQRQYCTFGKD